MRISHGSDSQGPVIDAECDQSRIVKAGRGSLKDINRSKVQVSIISWMKLAAVSSFFLSLPLYCNLAMPYFFPLQPIPLPRTVVCTYRELCAYVIISVDMPVRWFIHTCVRASSSTCRKQAKFMRIDIVVKREKAVRPVTYSALP